jgi:hypothetical protein
MALKRSDPSRDSRLTAANMEFQLLLANSDDRTAVLVGATLLEYRLAEYLRAACVADAKLVDGALDSRKPNALLGTFSAKIRVLQLFGLLSTDEASDLNTVREIRNDFAHNILGCTFADPEVIEHTKKLVLGWKATRDPNTPPRLVFNVQTHLLYSTLGYRILNCDRARIPADWIVG